MIESKPEGKSWLQAIEQRLNDRGQPPVERIRLGKAIADLISDRPVQSIWGVPVVIDTGHEGVVFERSRL